MDDEDRKLVGRLLEVIERQDTRTAALERLVAELVHWMPRAHRDPDAPARRPVSLQDLELAPLRDPRVRHALADLVRLDGEAAAVQARVALERDRDELIGRFDHQHEAANRLAAREASWRPQQYVAPALRKLEPGDRTFEQMERALSEAVKRGQK